MMPPPFSEREGEGGGISHERARGSINLRIPALCYSPKKVSMDGRMRIRSQGRVLRRTLPQPPPFGKGGGAQASGTCFGKDSGQSEGAIMRMGMEFAH